MTTRLTSDQAARYDEWIANQRADACHLIVEMEQISRQAGELIPGKPPKPEKHREISPVNTGTRTTQQHVTPALLGLSLARLPRPA